MFRWINKKFTKNYKEVPLFWVNFDLQKYDNTGEKYSCILKVHPTLKDDSKITTALETVIDYIRANYDMEELTK